MSASGSSPEVLSKVVHLQKALADSGMAKHEIASALTLAMAMANADTKETLRQLLDHFAEVLDGEVTIEQIQMLLSMAEAMSNGEMPEEVVRYSTNHIAYYKLHLFDNQLCSELVILENSLSA